MKRLFGFTETRAYIAYSIIICLIGLSMAMTSCGEDDAGRIVVLNISPELVPIGVRPPGNADEKVKLMECIVDGTNETFYISPNSIEGFEYVEGFKYKVRVRITDIDNPPADGYTEKYELMEIISKEQNIN